MRIRPTSVDLSACDTEPIHIIGAVQPHGALLAADAQTLVTEYASRSVEDYLGLKAEAAIGRPLSALLGEENIDALLSRPLDALKPDLIKPWFLSLEVEGKTRRLECFPHRHQGSLILEFVAFEEGPALVWEEDLLRQRIISQLITPRTLAELARVSAEIIRDVTGFDRVMIYRFAADKHGEVIAESTVRPDSFLGLHYPASDIPDPARRHFALNVIRSIPDINAPPSPILARGGGIADADHSAPLDLTYSKLRAVAPVHIEYLNNMGVGASMSISLISNDDLWGLVACHHYGPLHLPWSRFRFCELLGGTISSLLQSLENTQQLHQSISAERTASHIESRFRDGTKLGDIICEHACALMEHSGAQGMTLRLAGSERHFGRVPPAVPDFSALDDQLVEGVAATDSLPVGSYVDAADRRAAAGVALLVLSEDRQDQLVLYREEFEHTIKWAGKPDKFERVNEDGTVRLSPRGSFALWREERRGRSQPFTQSDMEALRILRRALFALNSLVRERAAVAAQKEAEAEEARLRMMVLEATRKSSLGELASALAHELNQPLAAVTNYINACRQELRNYGVAVPDRVSALIDNAVAESARAADLMRRLRNFIAEGELVLDEVDLSQIIRQGVRLALDSSKWPKPEVEFDIVPDLPAVQADRVQIGQVVLNLVRNSLPAMANEKERRLRISAFGVGEAIEVAVIDTGHGIPAGMEERLFEPFHASTTSGMGVGLSLCRTIVQAHGGRIWSRARPSGAEFVFTLPIRSTHVG
ncbi:GAF domain-containing protein [Chelativorans sp. ZYF759]|uniref:ATP-binding protein n=1 Tax=Chelativorans sp. ZYF759 TaxID=2692213 RepID=UPI00145EEDC5|nr:ATP-binding protein [Chelativorans sp. ZYF759]NMG41859.1 GAF domain-containing protein [Chelativorans sp. ZYF759]